MSDTFLASLAPIVRLSPETKGVEMLLEDGDPLLEADFVGTQTVPVA